MVVHGGTPTSAASPCVRVMGNGGGMEIFWGRRASLPVETPMPGGGGA